MTDQEVQDVINSLYSQIDKANEVFVKEKCGFSICRVLHMAFEEEESRPTEPKLLIDEVPWTGNCCSHCGGQLVRTGTCETCMNCGETTGGCS